MSHPCEHHYSDGSCDEFVCEHCGATECAERGCDCRECRRVACEACTSERGIAGRCLACAAAALAVAS